MITKKWKMIFLGIFAILLVCLPSLNGSDGSRLTSVAEDLVNQSPVNSNIDDPKNLVLNNAGNYGLKINASSLFQQSVTTGASSWTYDSGSGKYQTYTKKQWRVPFPVDLVAGNEENLDYRLTSGTVSVTGLTDTSNFIPIPGTDSENFYTVGWDPISTANSQFTDYYYGSSSSHINQTTQRISLSTETSTASGWDHDGSTDFDNAQTAEVGYVALDAARRFQTFSSKATSNSSTYTPTTLTPDDTNTGSTLPTTTTNGRTAWGSGSTYTAGEEGYNVRYSANYEPPTPAWPATSHTTNDDWPYGQNRNNALLRSTSALDTTNEAFTVSLSRQHYLSLYSKHSTSQTLVSAQSWARVKYYAEDWYTADYTMSFYYDDDSLDTPDIGYYTFGIDADQLGASSLGVNTAGSSSGIYSSGSCPITTSGKVTSYITKNSAPTTRLAEVTTDITSSSYTTISKTDKADIFSGTDTYKLHITVYLKVITNFDQAWYSPAIKASSEGTWVDAIVQVVNSTGSFNGISCKITTPRVIIGESVNMVQSGEHTPLLLKSNPIMWDKRAVISGATMVFRVGYLISDYIKGTDEAYSGLEYGYLSVKFTIKKTNVSPDKVFQYNMSSSLSTLISGNNKIGEFKVNMTGPNDYLDFKAALHQSDNFTMEVGLILKPNFQMSLSQSSLINSRIYFNNVAFNVVTRPTATFLGLELGFQNDAEANRYYYPMVDDASGTVSSVTLIGGSNFNFSAGGNDLSDEMWNNNMDWFFFRAKNNSLAFTWQAQFNIEVIDWTRNYSITFSTSKTYYTINSIIPTPKPASQPQSTTVFYNSSFISNWQDSFEFYLIVPRYEYGGGHIWWNLTTGTYNDVPGRSPETYNGYNSTVGLKTTEIYRQSNPPANMYGNSLNNGKIQVIHVFDHLFNTFTYYNYTAGSVVHGANSMNWTFQFDAPNEVGNVMVDHDSTFDYNDSKKFYITSSGSNQTVYVQTTTKTPQSYVKNYTANVIWKTPSDITRKTVNFSYNSGIPGYNSVSNSLVVGENDLGQDYPADLAERGPNWLAYGNFYLSDVIGVHRVYNTNAYQFLGGAYRGGMNYTTFSVVSLASVSIFAVTNTELVKAAGDNSTSYVFDSTTHVLEDIGVQANMINLSVVWRDFDLSPVVYNPADTTVTITLSSYNKPDAFMKYVPSLEYQNTPMISAGNGIFWLNFDPMNMDETMDTAGRHGNLTRGYHNYTITLTKTGMDTFYFTGNFSVKIDTLLEITYPTHEIFFGTKEYAHYDANSFLTDELYTITAEYRINSTSTTKELISNLDRSPYSPYVFMTYNLSAIYKYTSLSQSNPVPEPLSNYVYEDYFATLYGEDPYKEGFGWPTKGSMNHTAGDGAFRASFSWPNFEHEEYKLLAPSWASQSTDPCIYAYNISVYCAVNRSYDYRYTWQMHDLESQSCEGLVSNGTGYSNLVKVKEEIILLKLNSNSEGNFSRVILVNDVPEDNNPFQFEGEFDQDLENIENFQGLYSPSYRIRNYRDRIGTEYFRLRVILNCTKANNALDNSVQLYKSGWWEKDQDFYVLGPVNDTTVLYGLNQTWTSNTTIKLFDWNASTLIFTPDYSHTWGCWVNSSGVQFYATGVSYVSPWLCWADRDVGINTIRIQAIKDGFISAPQPVVVEVIPTPTRLFNGSKTNPDFDADVIGATEETRLNLTTSTGKSISFLLNYTDITNYNATHPQYSVLRPVVNATMKCTEDDNPSIWENGTGTGGLRTSWKYEYLGNGVYNITIIKIDVDVSSDNGKIWNFKFQFERQNYVTQEFLLALNVTKRVSKFYFTLPSKDTDYFYYYSDGEGAYYNWTKPLNLTKLSVQFKVADEENGSYNIKVKDYNILQNSKIVLSYRLASLPASSDKLLAINDEYSINENWSSGLPCYDVNLTNYYDTGPGVYTITVNLFNVDNYYNSLLMFNITILETPTKIELVSSTSSRGYYPLVENTTTEEKYMPQYLIRYTDAIRNTTLNEPIQLPYRTQLLGFGGYTASSNFTNTYRSLSVAYSGEEDANRLNKDDEGIQIDNLVRAMTVAGKPYIFFMFDIFGIDVLADSQGNYLPRTVQLTLQWKYYQTQTINLDFIIVNATTRLWAEKSWNSSLPNEVMVKCYEPDSDDLLKYNNLGEIYQSNNGAVVYPVNIPWGYAVQVQLCYRSFGTVMDTPIQDNSANDYFFVYSGSNTGITNYKVFIANNSNVAGLTAPLKYTIFQFTASPSSIPVIVSYDFAIWKKNFNPINYTVRFNVVSRQSYCEVNAMPDRPGVSNVAFKDVAPEYDYSQTVSWTWKFMDSKSKSSIASKEYPVSLILNNGTELLEQGVDNAKYYQFDSGMTAKIWFYLDYSNNYVIKIDTQSLVARSAVYTVNLTFTAPFYDTAQLLWKDAKTSETMLPRFKVTPVQLNVKIWLFNDIKLNPDTELGERFSAKYSYNESKLDTTRVYIYVKPYATLYDDDNRPYEEAVYDNITVTIKLYDLTEYVDDEPVFITSFNITRTTGMFYEAMKMQVTYDGKVVAQDLPSLTQVVVEVTCSNTNFLPCSSAGEISINKGTTEVPPYMWIIVFVSIGSMVGIGMYGVRKALLLRIPFVLRMIDESIEKISKDKFPTVGVMLGRNEYVINKVIDFLDECGIEWSVSDKIESTAAGEEDEGESGGKETTENKGPMNLDEITVELNKISTLTPDEREMFIDELKRLDRKGQDEFLKSLREDSGDKK